MKSFFPLVCLSVLPLFAQTQPQFLLARFPYIPETPRVRTLDIDAVLRSLPPLDLGIEGPIQIPEHLQFSAEERVWVHRLREAYQLIGERRFEEAHAIFTDFPSVYPDHAPTRVALADTFFSMGKHREARDAYLAVLADFPNSFQVLNNLAWLYSTADDPEILNPGEAIALARRAMVVEPNSHHVWSTLSRALHAAGRFEEATRAAINAHTLASRFGADSLVIVNYHNQVEQSRKAALATSLMD